jgi:hypothetical protein
MSPGKKPRLWDRGGAWFACGAQKHGGMDDAIPNTRRFCTADPWGNRIELLAG